jgi:hypothetical protein
LKLDEAGTALVVIVEVGVRACFRRRQGIGDGVYEVLWEILWYFTCFKAEMVNIS